MYRHLDSESGLRIAGEKRELHSQVIIFHFPCQLCSALFSKNQQPTAICVNGILKLHHSLNFNLNGQLSRGV